MNAFYEGLAEIFEVDVSFINSDTELAELNWDSLAIVSTIALVDETHGRMLDGSSLARCQTVGDIEGLIAMSAAA
jgi:acyl carrier protein